MWGDTANNIIIADSGNNVIRKVDATTQIITTIAGVGSATNTGDGLAATSTGLSNPSGIWIDSQSNIYIADQGNNCVRKMIVATNIIYVIAGVAGTAGYNNNLIATTSLLNAPINVIIFKKY